MDEPLTQEEYQQLLNLGTEGADLKQQMEMQMAQAKAMRAGGAPQMRDAGRMQVAPHWTELLGALAKQKTGNDLEQQALATGKSRNAAMGQQNGLIAKGITAPQAAPQDTGSGFGLPAWKSPFSFGGGQ